MDAIYDGHAQTIGRTGGPERMGMEVVGTTPRNRISLRKTVLLYERGCPRFGF